MFARMTQIRNIPMRWGATISVMALVLGGCAGPGAVRDDRATAAVLTVEPLPCVRVGSDPRGVLVIAGGGVLVSSIHRRFRELAGDGLLVVIPTASERADREESEDELAATWRRRGFDHVIVLHTRDREAALDPAFAEPIRRANAVWFGGGQQTRLAESYLGTAVEEEVRALLARGGVVGGSSAGASIMSRIMIYGGNPIASTREGLGLLEGCVIDQHFTERQREARLHGVVHRYPSWMGIGIDERTAIVVRGTHLEVVGDRGAHVFVAHQGRTPVSLKSGDAYDLALRRRLDPEEAVTATGVGDRGMLTP